MKINDSIEQLLQKYLDEFEIWSLFRGKSILITGANGNLGKGIIYLLLYADSKSGLDLHIYGSTRDPSAQVDWIDENDHIEFIRYGHESEDLVGRKIDYIIHAACPTDRNIFIKYPNDVFFTIIRDTERLLNIAEEKGARMLYLSSDAEYGSWSSDHAIDESEFGAIDSLNYRSCYPLGKKTSEYICYSSFVQKGSDVVICRPSIILGLFQKYEDPKVMSYFVRCLVEGKNIVLNTPGDTVKPMIFTLDAACACLFLLLSGKAGEAYNVTNDKICMSIREYAELLCDKFGKGSKVEYNFMTDAAAGFAATSKLALSIGKILSLGWRPLIDFEDLFNIELRRFNYL